MKIVKEQENKNPQEYGYTGDEKIEITAREFAIFKSAIEAGINATIDTYMPEVTKFVNVETTEDVFNPSAQDIASGAVVEVMDRTATFSNSNIKIKYNPTKLTKDMTYAHELIFEVHNRNIETGVAKHKSELDGAE